MCDSMRNTFNLRKSTQPNPASFEVSESQMQPDSFRPNENWPTIEIFRPLESCLTSKDYFVLEKFLNVLTDRKSSEATLLARLIRTKLADTQIVLSEDVKANVATSGSRVTYSVDRGRLETRSLVFGETSPVPNYNLPIFTLLGVGLLGMKIGQTAPWIDYASTVGALTLNRIEYQPQSCRERG